LSCSWVAIIASALLCALPCAQAGQLAGKARHRSLALKSNQSKSTLSQYYEYSMLGIPVFAG
jgi:hypothetical protein